MKTILAGLGALALAAAVAVPAAAQERNSRFPMPAAAYEKHVEKKIERARARMEAGIKNDHVPDDQASAMRARFESIVANVNAEVSRAVADGTVNADEAKSVRAVARELHAGHGHHHHVDA